MSGKKKCDHLLNEENTETGRWTCHECKEDITDLMYRTREQREAERRERLDGRGAPEREE